MSKTIVGLFNSMSAAQQVRQTLIAGGYEANRISIVANDGDDVEETGATAGGTTAERAKATATGMGEKISNFFNGLSGGDEDAHTHYAHGVNQGGALLTVKAEDNDASEVAVLLKQYGARDIEGGDKSVRNDSTEMIEGQTAIPIIEEQMVVGKREVDRGGVRVYSHVVERAVEADVTLRNETVGVQRRVVDRPATAADFAAGNGSIEMRATGEEAVVGKSSRVVEEVMVGKQASEHVEAIHDTVRKTEVEVEQLTGKATGNNRS